MKERCKCHGQPASEALVSLLRRKNGLAEFGLLCVEHLSLPWRQDRLRARDVLVRAYARAKHYTDSGSGGR